MPGKEYCRICGRELVPDEIGATKKLINRGAEEFLCLTCLSRHFEVNEELILEKIEQFKKDGCLLFQ